MTTATFLRSVPKTETHLHLEGALPWELLQTLDHAKYAARPASHGEAFRFADFAHFERELLGFAGAWFTSAERYHQAAKAIFARHLAEGVRYVETSFASGCLEFATLDGREVCEAITAAVPPGLAVRLFMGLHHDNNSPFAAKLMEDSLKWDGIAGFDLHGTETVPLEPWTPRFWERARAVGKFTKAHAGEFCGPDFVWRVIRELKVTRIEHGIRSIEDPVLVNYLAENNIGLDVCPISNVKLATVPDFARHPLRRLHAAGVRCTINSDDPLSFGNTLLDDYRAFLGPMGGNLAELISLIRNGFELALLDPAERARHLSDLDLMSAQLLDSRAHA